MNWLAKAFFYYDLMLKSIRVNVSFLSPETVFFYYIIAAVINMYCFTLGLRMIKLKKTGFISARRFAIVIILVNNTHYYFLYNNFVAGINSSLALVFASAFCIIFSLWLYVFCNFAIKKTGSEAFIIVNGAIPSFPNSIWERHCGRNSIAAAGWRRLNCRANRIPAIELPEQVRSQMEFGNESRKRTEPRIDKITATQRRTR